MSHASRGVDWRPRGFTLVELTIVLFIISLLIAGMMGPVAVQMEARDRRTTQVAMEKAVEALYGYALTNRRLPCPDTNGDGRSDPVFDPALVATATCAVGGVNGFLPWAELGVDPGDAWSNRITYRVRHPEFTWPAANTSCDGNSANELDLCATGNIVVETRGDNAATAGTVEGKFNYPAATTDNVVAVVVSHGRNSFGAVSTDGVARPAVPAAQADELENADNDVNFISRNYTAERNGCADNTTEATPLCAFDDIVMTVSRAILNSRMVAAGQLP